MTRLTDDALAAIRARAEEATPGPWRDLPGWDDATDTENNDRIVTSDYTDDNRDQRAVVVGEIWYDGPHVLVAPVDATFIAAARTDVPAMLDHIVALDGQIEELTAQREAMTDGALLAIKERDTLAAKLAEVERERDEARRDFAAVRGFLDDNPNALGNKLRAALAEQRRLAAEVERLTAANKNLADANANYVRLGSAQNERLAAEVERMRPVVEAAGEYVDWPRGSGALVQSVIAYRAAPQPPAVEPAPIDMLLFCPRCDTQHVDAPHGDWTNPPHRSHECQHCRHVWRPADVATNGVSTIKTAGKVDGPASPAEARIASAIRALTDSAPPSGMIERVIERSLPRLAEAERQAEVRRCEQAVVEAAVAFIMFRTSGRVAGRHERIVTESEVERAVDALLAAREKAGGGKLASLSAGKGSE